MILKFLNNYQIDILVDQVVYKTKAFTYYKLQHQRKRKQAHVQGLAVCYSVTGLLVSFAKSLLWNEKIQATESIPVACIIKHIVGIYCSYENKSINLPVMFESLSKIRTKKLRRVFISCDHSDATSTKALEMFLNVNPQLVLFFLAVQTSPKSFLQTAQQLLNQYKMNSRYKQFYAKTDARSFIKNYHVCEAEEELFNYDSAVSTVNFYDFR